ncbi:hypothetical protein MKEN_00121100 [Mycena kentingensis (nom. inval.)]|nr:hypothetical protein MKEN_00121100 [Mycena kentingensis (nom. inval.)]
MKPKPTYSVTLDWREDEVYEFLSSLRDGLGHFPVPVHISVANFLKLADDGLAHLKEFLRKVSQTHSVHEVVFGIGMMKANRPVFGEDIVAIPVVLAGELKNIWDVFKDNGIVSRHPPHVTITIGDLARDRDLGLHDYVRESLLHWKSRRGVMKARGVGLELWQHKAGKRQLMERFPLAKECFCRICIRAKRLEAHGCSCTICFRALRSAK